MKLEDGVPRRAGVTRPAGSPGLAFGSSRMSPLPLEWMDPMSWRLPSGKALAEFALQAGFLAPLLLSGPSGIGRAGIRRGKPAAGGPGKVGCAGPGNTAEGAPTPPGTLRRIGTDEQRP
jgi:hypothetical protein